MSQLNDISLVAQVVVFRNTRAFDQLVQKYQSPVRRFFLNLTCGDSELYNPQIQISAESGTKRSIFRQKNKTKRSKKKAAHNTYKAGAKG